MPRGPRPPALTAPCSFLSVTPQHVSPYTKGPDSWETLWGAQPQGRKSYGHRRVHAPSKDMFRFYAGKTSPAGSSRIRLECQQTPVFQGAPSPTKACAWLSEHLPQLDLSFLVLTNITKFDPRCNSFTSNWETLIPTFGIPFPGPKDQLLRSRPKAFHLPVCRGQDLPSTPLPKDDAMGVVTPLRSAQRLCYVTEQSDAQLTSPWELGHFYFHQDPKCKMKGWIRKILRSRAHNAF